MDREFFEVLSAKETVGDIVLDYRMTFSTAHGRRVLADILDACGFSDGVSPGDAGAVGTHNLAWFILARLGVDIRKDKYLRAIIDVPITDIQEVSG